MQGAFEVLIFVVVGVGVVVAAITLASNGSVYDQIGRGGMSLNEDGARPPAAASVAPASASEREEEIRQMLIARSDRLVRRGRPPLDVESEVRRLVRGATGDPALVAEIRQLVHARNARRARQGKPPLDVEAEVARQLGEADL